MKVLEKISDFAGKWMAIIALAVAIIAFVAPAPVHAALPTSWVNPLLGIVMFGMGMTLKLGDFKVVFTKPKAVITGILSQFIIMPLIAWVLCLVFQLPTELAVGVMLVGCCPGGTSSNVMTYLSKGDVALSVGMTACTTIMAPVVTPALVLLLAGQSVDVSYVSMLLSIVQVVLVPIALGFVINAVASKVAQACSKVLPLVSVIAISLIIMAVVSANAAKLATVGALIIVVVMLHNICGYALGYFVGRALGLSKAQMRTCPSRWACRTPAWRPRLPPCTSLPCRWPPCPAPCSACGTTSPAPSTPTSWPAPPARTRRRNNAAAPHKRFAVCPGFQAPSGYPGGACLRMRARTRTGDGGVFAIRCRKREDRP